MLTQTQDSLLSRFSAFLAITFVILLASMSGAVVGAGTALQVPLWQVSSQDLAILAPVGAVGGACYAGGLGLYLIVRWSSRIALWHFPLHAAISFGIVYVVVESWVSMIANC